MTDLLIRIFIKDHSNPSDTVVREKYGVFSSIVGIITNLILAGMKLVAGLLSFSIAIVADALNNLSDAGSSLISFVSFKNDTDGIVIALGMDIIVDVICFLFSF